MGVVKPVDKKWIISAMIRERAEIIHPERRRGIFESCQKPRDGIQFAHTLESPHHAKADISAQETSSHEGPRLSGAHEDQKGRPSALAPARKGAQAHRGQKGAIRKDPVRRVFCEKIRKTPLLAGFSYLVSQVRPVYMTYGSMKRAVRSPGCVLFCASTRTGKIV